MTLQNGLYHRGEAYLWSDTGFWSTSGARVGSGCKTFAGSLFPWAATFSGASPALEPYRLVRLIGERTALTPASLIDAVVDVLRQESRRGRDNRVLLAFPCMTQGARLYHIAADVLPGRDAFQPVCVAKFACWGAEEDWYAPFAGRDLTPAEMRQVVALQLQGNAEAMFELAVENPVSDIIETRVSRAGIHNRQLRLIDGELVEVALGNGLGNPPSLPNRTDALAA